MPDRIRPRGDTAANWTATNPVLQTREIGLETDTRRYKVGDGATAWNSLAYNLIGDRYSTTSTTSNTISNGAKTFTVVAGLAYTPEQTVIIVATAGNHMHATVTSYSGTTLVVDVIRNTGTGTFSAWTINIAGALSTVPGTPNVQTFGSPTAATTGNWNKPTGGRLTRIQIWGAAGGGGSGRKGAAATVRCGGGGGGSGPYAELWIETALLGATETVTTGAGGAGGAAQVNVDSNGLSGTAGGATSFGTWLVLPGANQGSGGTATTGIAGGGGLGGNSGGTASTSGAAGAGGVPSTTGSACTSNLGSGAAGGGITSADVASIGATGGRSLLNAALAQGAAGAVGGDGGAGTSTNPLPTNGATVGATGGGSGGSSVTGNGGAGGAGGFPGGGGAGGGAALNTGGNSGPGGSGGFAAAIITTYF